MKQSFFVAVLATIPILSIAAEKFDAVDTVNSFEQKFGVTEGKRRNHTKGFCFEAEFLPNTQVMNKYSTSPIFADKTTVIGRLSHKGGNNLADDSKPGEYGMGLSFILENEVQHRMAMNTLDFFPVATPEAFAELMRAKVKGDVAEFKSKNKDLQRFKKHMSKKIKALSPYEAKQFNSINSFVLVNDKSEETPVRWSFKPTTKDLAVNTPSANYYFENIRDSLKKTAVTWDMAIIIANEKDDINNAAIPWLGERKTLHAATLKLKSVMSEIEGRCDEINFDPLILSRGFKPSNDPLLQARRQAYAVSFSKRISEKAK